MPEKLTRAEVHLPETPNLVNVNQSARETVVTKSMQEMSQSTKKMGTIEKLSGAPAGLPFRLNTGQDLQAEITLSGNKIISFCTSDEAQQLV